MALLLVYTRQPEAALYHAALARSVHFACDLDGQGFQPLNLNYGMLFAEGTVNADNTIAPKALLQPRVRQTEDGAYLVQAQQLNASGEAEALYPQWTTRDFIDFQYLGVCETPAPMPAPETAVTLAGAVSGNCLTIPDTLARKMIAAWSPLTNTEIRVPALVTAADEAQAKAICAAAVYSDGSTCQKPVDWDLTGVDFTRPGDYPMTGTVRQLEPDFPIQQHHGDPVVFHWQGQVYYIYTNDFNDDRGFIVRRAQTVEGLFAPDVEQSLILDESEQFVQTFWAPEFHEIGGALYLLFAVSGKRWGPQCHLMKLKPGGDILCAEDWTNPVRVCRSDGSNLTDTAITLDMTYFQAGARHYVVWSYREGIGTKRDSGSMLYIATIDPQNPARLTSEPVLLSRPLLGWENIDGTINNEGPYAFVHEGVVYLTYSGGAANGYSYAVGLLTAEADRDLLHTSNWRKRPTPVLHYGSISGRFGPGHNSFFQEGGERYIAYHAEYNTSDSPRCAALHRVHIDSSGLPRFDLGPERDLSPALRAVHTVIRI